MPDYKSREFPAGTTEVYLEGAGPNKRNLAIGTIRKTNDKDFVDTRPWQALFFPLDHGGIPNRSEGKAEYLSSFDEAYQWLVERADQRAGRQAAQATTPIPAIP